MNYVFRIGWGWGQVRVICAHPTPGATVAAVELADHTGATVVLDPDAADELAEHLLTTGDGQDAVISRDSITLAPLAPGMLDHAATKLHRAAGLARAQYREPAGPHRFLIAGR